jgi:FAD/FMN-containing dehydrogenase
MQRRDLLQAVTALPLLAVAARLPAAADGAHPRLTRVRPSDPAWPSPAEWHELSDAVGGSLVPVQPLFAARAKEPAAAACREVLANIRNPFYIGDQAGGTEVSGWLDAWTPAPSVYAVRARSAADVAAAVKFARAHRLRLVVKGGGHSYLGTSNSADSLLVWTRAMNTVTLHDAFVPVNCAGRVAPQPAVTAGAGAMWIDLYDVVTARAGRYVQGGGCTSVGIAGLIQSGGFGSFSKGFGTAASGLLEAEVVTADGRVRTVNACSDPDLFWALKGGGGGTFGAVTRLTLRTHELPEFFGAAWGRIRCHSDDAFRRLLARFFDFYAASLLNPHWGEQVHVGSGNVLELSMVQQGLDQERVSKVWQPFFDWVAASPGEFSVSDGLHARATAARHWWDVDGNPSMIKDPRAGAAPYHGWWQGDQDQVGAFLHGFDSLWLPATLLSEQARPRLVEALFAASRHKKVELHFNKGLAGAPPPAIAAARDTATNPDVTGAFALAIIADGERASYPGMTRPPMDLGAAHHDAREIDAAAAELRKVAPAAGSYVSESNYFNARWQQDYWGSNYPRLRTIKDRYDPDGLFFAHHGVGSENWSSDGFIRKGS